MIGLDTNVIVRYIVQDDHRQAARATRIIEQECSEDRRGFVSTVVLAELVWVLESCYDSSRSEVIDVLQHILRAKQFAVQDAETAWKALRRFEDATSDFSDCLIERTGAAHDCEYTGTFDKAAARVGMRLLE
ncbi:MAG TPA: type II toxin-antitoxin system VapC family toxin [Burkholderiales bacterium]